MATKCADCGTADAVHDSPRQHPDAVANAGLCTSCYDAAFAEVNGPDAPIHGGPDQPPVYNVGDEVPV